jgi:hypothetical protein
MAICCGGLYILSSLNQLNQRKRKAGNLLDVSCFVWGRIMLGQCFFFFFFSLLERLNQNTYLQMPIGPLGRVLKDKYQNLKRRRIWQMSKLGLEMRESSQKNKIVYDGYVKLNFIVA